MLSILALVAGLGVSPQTDGPSFDCRRASTEVERAICANPVLARQDRRVADAYAAARSRLPPAARTALLRDQRWFLGVRDEAYENRDRWPGFGTLSERMQERIEFLDTVRASEQGDLIGRWQNIAGGVDLVRTGPDTIRTDISTAQPVNARWICNVEAVVNIVDGQIEMMPDQETNWKIRITSKPGHIEVEQIKQVEGFSNPGFCGANGSVAGAYFRVE